MTVAGHELARWQGRTEERLDWLEESAQRIERACNANNTTIETAVQRMAERVGLLELASGKSSVRVAIIVAVLGTLGGIIGTALATVAVYFLLHVHL